MKRVVPTAPETAEGQVVRSDHHHHRRIEPLRPVESCRTDERQEERYQKRGLDRKLAEWIRGRQRCGPTGQRDEELCDREMNMPPSISTMIPSRGEIHVVEQTGEMTLDASH